VIAHDTLRVIEVITGCILIGIIFALITGPPKE
jgi:hypothetical protein